MATLLSSPNPPVMMLNGHTSQAETSFTVQCHDKTFRVVTATSDADSHVLFRVEGETWGTSWSLRRKVYDGSPNNSPREHLFDFRHNSMDIKNGWVVESTNGAKICEIVHKEFFTKDHSSVNAMVRTQAGEQVLVVMRTLGHDGTTATVSVGDETFATIDKVEDNDSWFRGKLARSVWRARAAAGVDLSLVMVMVLCRAEMGHVWKQ